MLAQWTTLKLVIGLTVLIYMYILYLLYVLIYLFIYLFIYSFIHLFVCLFIYLFLYFYLNGLVFYPTPYFKDLLSNVRLFPNVLKFVCNLYARLSIT